MSRCTIEDCESSVGDECSWKQLLSVRKDTGKEKWMRLYNLCSYNRKAVSL
jgi:hypothetical protein